MGGGEGGADGLDSCSGLERNVRKLYDDWLYAVTGLGRVQAPACEPAGMAALFARLLVA